MRARLLLIVPAVAGVAFLGACGSDGDASNGVSSAERTAYLSMLSAANVTFADDDAAVAAGEKACADLAAGKTVLEVGGNIEGQDANKGSVVVGAATMSFCRDQIGNGIPSLPSIPNLPTE